MDDSMKAKMEELSAGYASRMDAYVEDGYMTRPEMFSEGFTACHDLMTKEFEEVKTERDWILKVGQVRKDNIKLRTDLALAVEALETLEVAVNDKVNDPGATNFIRKTLAKINQAEEKK